MKSITRVHLGATFLLIIGLLGVVVSTLPMRSLRTIPLALRASPNPDVFSKRWSVYQFELIGHKHGGDYQILKVDNAAIEKIKGPLTRFDAYTHAFTFAAITNSRHSVSILILVACKKEGLLAEIGFNGDFELVQFNVKDPALNNKTIMSKIVRCSKR